MTIATRSLMFLPVALLLFLSLQCSKDDGPSTPPGDQTPATASTVVRSNQDGHLGHPSGSAIRVPAWSVPLTADSSIGEMLFTIDVGPHERFGVPRTPPAGWQFATEIHSMGPEGFIFAAPVVASIPLPAGFDPIQNDVCMADYDRVNGRWKTVGGRISADGRSLEVDGIHLCTNALITAPWSSQGVGAIQFNTLPGYSFKVCIENYTLLHPERDGGFVAQDRIARIDRRDVSTTPPDGFMYWRLPQGTYTLSIMVYRHDPSDPMQRPEYLGYFQRTITLDHPHWNWQLGTHAPDYENAVFFGDLTPYVNPAALTQGVPGCWSAPTPSVGIGAINVRLEWSDSADLDLHVYDPCGNHIYYANRNDTCQASIGRLDLDNWCSNLVVGRPENIFWQLSPPRGLYTVRVKYFGDCATTGPVFYTVRWTVSGSTQSRSGTLAPYDTVTVAQFTY